MTAPFELPDRVNIWNSAGTTIVAANVPARVVPCLMKTFSVWNSATNTQVTGMSHWVDLNFDFQKYEYQQLIAALHYNFDYDAGLLIKLEVAGFELVLRGMWQELRYTNTDNEYQRIYCSRVSQDLL